jgi:hypothetical protein
MTSSACGATSIFPLITSASGALLKAYASLSPLRRRTETSSSSGFAPSGPPAAAIACFSVMGARSA